MSLRISATLLESFRLYATDTVDNEAEVIATIKGQPIAQKKNMQIGHAFHYLLEHPQRSLTGFYEHNGFWFSPDAIDSVLERLAPGGVFETKVAKSIGFTREGDECVLVCKADHIAGLDVSEFKAPLAGTVDGEKYSGHFDAEKYGASVQWKVEAMLYQANRVTYHVACLREDDDARDCFELKSLDSMHLFPYAQLENDVKHLVRELLRFARIKKIDSYLRREDRKAVGA